MVSMKDVSRHAGVSVATVSNVITGKKNVSDKIRLRVLDSISALDYQVNLVARGLKTQRTSTIGLILPDITKLFFQNVISGILSESLKLGYRLQIFNSSYDLENERMHINMLRASRVDGIILDSCVDKDRAHVWAEELLSGNNSSTPIVSIESTMGHSALSSITVNNALYSRQMTQHLFDIGRRRILYVSGPLQLEHEYDRLFGYRQCHQINHIPLDEALQKTGTYLSEAGYSVVKEALDNGLQFDAVQASNDQAAIGALKALQEFGKRVPEDVAVSGFDNLFPATLVTPAITTISVPTFDIGVQATRMLIEHIDNPDSPPSLMSMDASLIVRASTVPEARSSWDLSRW